MKRKLLVAGGVLVVVVVVCAAILGVLVGSLLDAGKVGTRVEVVLQERCAKLMNIKYFRNRLGFLTAAHTRAVYVLSDGRELDYDAFTDGNDGKGNFCDTIYVPKERNVAIPATSSVPPIGSADCPSWDWDFNTPDGSIGFRCTASAR